MYARASWPVLTNKLLTGNTGQIGREAPSCTLLCHALPPSIYGVLGTFQTHQRLQGKMFFRADTYDTPENLLATHWGVGGCHNLPFQKPCARNIIQGPSAKLGFPNKSRQFGGHPEITRYSAGIQPTNRSKNKLQLFVMSECNPRHHAKDCTARLQS